MSFASRLAKGRIGERIVDEWLVARGFVPYRPQDGVAHPFDRLVASGDKRRIGVVEVKSKPRREKYPDQGIPTRHYTDYKHISDTYGIRVFIAFVDEVLAKIYGNFLDELEKPRGRYPLKYADTIYFPLEAMRDIAPLTQEQCAELAVLRDSKHDRRFGISGAEIGKGRAAL